jgi:dGTP triphosphohydrolase
MNFSSILDISSFFVGMIINLLLIALICYYFKRKYENLELAQNEQAKILYDLLQKDRKPCMMEFCPKTVNAVIESRVSSNSSNSSNSSKSSKSSDSSDSDSDRDSDSESEMDVGEEVEIKHLSIQEISVPDNLSFTVTKVESSDYSKMTMKQLKDVLTSKGIRTKPTMRKDELIELATKEFDPKTLESEELEEIVMEELS